MRAPSRLASTCLLLSAAAWLGACPVAPSYPSCTQDAQCERGESCVDGQCQNCTTDAECVGKGPAGSDMVCLEFRCSEPPAGATDPCASCEPGLVCSEGSCEACREGAQCDSGVCHPSGRCQALPCATDDACPDAQICDGGQCLHYVAASGGGEPCGLAPIYFAYDSAQLSPDNQTRLVAAASCLAQLEGVLVLEASADAVGTAEYNTLLAQRRGETVLRFLTQQGVEGARTSVAAQPAADGDEHTHAPQRRVRFVLENE